jgi:hypothetical protein
LPAVDHRARRLAADAEVPQDDRATGPLFEQAVEAGDVAARLRCAGEQAHAEGVAQRQIEFADPLRRGGTGRDRARRAAEQGQQQGERAEQARDRAAVDAALRHRRALPERGSRHRGRAPGGPGRGHPRRRAARPPHPATGRTYRLPSCAANSGNRRSARRRK